MTREQADGDLISRQAVLDELNKWDWQELYLPIHFKENIIDVVPSVKPQEPTGHCKDCKHFRKLPYHAGAIGKCVQHWGFCPPSDWYCADFEPQERSEE